MGSETGGVTSTEVPEKCIKQFVLNVTKNVKFLLSRPRVSQFIAENALANVRVINDMQEM
jgi:hypothetical protein